MSNDSSWYKQRQAFNDLVDLWDKAQADGIFESGAKNIEAKSDFFGQSYYASDESEFQNDDASYWNDVVSRSGEMFPDESMVLMEAAKNKATAKKKTTKKKPKNKKENDDQPLGDMGSKPFKKVTTSVEKDGEPNLKDKVKKLANKPQLVKPDTYGSDTVDKENKVKVTAGLAAHPAFEELEKLKKEMEVAERMMSGMDKNGVGGEGLSDKKIRQLEKKFKDIRQKISDLSDKFSGDYKSSNYYS